MTIHTYNISKVNTDLLKLGYEYVKSIEEWEATYYTYEDKYSNTIFVVNLNY